MKFLRTVDGLLIAPNRVELIVENDYAIDASGNHTLFDRVYFRHPNGAVVSSRLDGDAQSQLYEHTVIPALAGYFAVNASGKKIPIVAWEVFRTHTNPVCIATLCATDVWAVLDPNGQVTDAFDKQYKSMSAYLAAQHKAAPKKRRLQAA